MEKDCSRSFNTGILAGFIIVGLVFLLISQVNPFFSIEIIPKETSMNSRVRAISSQWDGCWLSIGENDHALYWKCDGFASKISDWVCKSEKFEAVSSNAPKGHD